MSKQIKQKDINFEVAVSLYDKTQKNVEYNYLVEVSFKGRTTHLSKTFVELEDAEKYYEDVEQQIP